MSPTSVAVVNGEENGNLSIILKNNTKGESLLPPLEYPSLELLCPVKVYRAVLKSPISVAVVNGAPNGNLSIILDGDDAGGVVVPPLTYPSPVLCCSAEKLLPELKLPTDVLEVNGAPNGNLSTLVPGAVPLPERYPSLEELLPATVPGFVESVPTFELVVNGAPKGNESTAKLNDPCAIKPVSNKLGALADGVTVEVTVGVGVTEDVGVTLGVTVTVGVTVGVGVTDSVGVGVILAVTVGVTVSVGVTVTVTAGVAVGVTVAVGVGVTSADGETVGVTVGVIPEVGDGVTVTAGVTVGVTV